MDPVLVTLRAIGVRAARLVTIGRRRVANALNHFLRGIECKYPPCCVLEFSLDELLGRDKQAFRKGAVMTRGQIQPYIPCWIHRHLFFHITHAEAIALTGALPQVMNEKGEVITIMPDIRCMRCGVGKWYHDIHVNDSIESCPECRTPHHIVDRGGRNDWKVEPVFPNVDELKEVWNLLDELERSRLTEASRCLGIEAYTMSEAACFDALASILRRVYGGKHELGTYVERMGKDQDLTDLRGVISYFSGIRNKVDHPVSISKPLDAESTFTMTKRLILGIAHKRADKLRGRADEYLARLLNDSKPS